MFVVNSVANIEFAQISSTSNVEVESLDIAEKAIQRVIDTAAIENAALDFSLVLRI